MRTKLWMFINFKNYDVRLNILFLQDSHRQRQPISCLNSAYDKQHENIFKSELIKHIYNLSVNKVEVSGDWRRSAILEVLSCWQQLQQIS